MMPLEIMVPDHNYIGLGMRLCVYEDNSCKCSPTVDTVTSHPHIQPPSTFTLFAPLDSQPHYPTFTFSTLHPPTGSPPAHVQSLLEDDLGAEDGWYSHAQQVCRKGNGEC